MHQVETISVAEKKHWRICYLGLIPFMECHRLQLGLIEAWRAQRFEHNLVLLLQHPPVFTMGRRGGRRNLIVDELFLSERGIDLVAVERGGDITYHGPGQLVGYLLLNFNSLGMDIGAFVRSIEETMIRVSQDFSVIAGRRKGSPGIWSGDKKLGSIGIAIRHGVTFHGFALNVDMDLSPFSWINPCGMPGIDVVSLASLSNQHVDISNVSKKVESHLKTIFQVTLERVDPESLYPFALQNSSLPIEQ